MNQRSLRRIALTGAMVLGISASLPVQPVGAACSGYGCDGVDAYSSAACVSGATTNKTRNIYVGGVNIGLVELRWSNTCGTNWTRVTPYVNNVRTIERVETGDGRAYQDEDVLSVGIQGASPLVYAPGILARGVATMYYNGQAVTVYTDWD